MNGELHVSDVVAGAPSTSRMVRRALVRRCPRCGSGRVFDGWLHMVDRCPGCGMRFRRDEGFFLGAFTLNLIVTLFCMWLVLIWLVIKESMNASGSIRLPLIVGALCGTVLPVAFYPYSYSLWAVFDLSSAPLELKEITDAMDARDGMDPDGDDDVRPAADGGPSAPGAESSSGGGGNLDGMGEPGGSGDGNK